MSKTVNKKEIKGNFLNLIKGIHTHTKKQLTSHLK
jgi:hypothetical protein